MRFEGRTALVTGAARGIGLASDDCTFTTGAVHDLSGGRATY